MSCPTCNGKGFVECEVVVEVQLGDEVPYDSTIARYTGQALKRRQRVETGVWDCPDCDEGDVP